MNNFVACMLIVAVGLVGCAFVASPSHHATPEERDATYAYLASSDVDACPAREGESACRAYPGRGVAR